MAKNSLEQQNRELRSQIDEMEKQKRLASAREKVRCGEDNEDENDLMEQLELKKMDCKKLEKENVELYGSNAEAVKNQIKLEG